TEAFIEAALKSGMSREDIELLFKIAKETPLPSGWGVGSHQKCYEWVLLFEKKLNAALREKNKSGSHVLRGCRTRKLRILDVPLGAKGNTRDDIPFLWKIIPYAMDIGCLGGPTAPDMWKKELLGQEHTVFMIVLKDGSVWYFDLGAL